MSVDPATTSPPQEAGQRDALLHDVEYFLGKLLTKLRDPERGLPVTKQNAELAQALGKFGANVAAAAARAGGPTDNTTPEEEQFKTLATRVLQQTALEADTAKVAQLTTHVNSLREKLPYAEQFETWEPGAVPPEASASARAFLARLQRSIES